MCSLSGHWQYALLTGTVRFRFFCRCLLIAKVPLIAWFKPYSTVQNCRSPSKQNWTEHPVDDHPWFLAGSSPNVGSLMTFFFPSWTIMVWFVRTSLGSIGNDDSLIYFLTNQDAQNYRVMTFDYSQPAAGFTTLVPEKSDSVLMAASIHATNKLVLFYQHLAQMELHIHDLGTGKKLRQIFKELAGLIAPFSAACTVEEIYFIYNDFISPGSVYRQALLSLAKESFQLRISKY